MDVRRRPAWESSEITATPTRMLVIVVKPLLASGVGCVNGAAAAAAASPSPVIRAKNTKGRRAEAQHMQQCRGRQRAVGCQDRVYRGRRVAEIAGGLESEDRDAQHGACNYRQRRHDSRGGPAAGEGTVPRVVLR